MVLSIVAMDGGRIMTRAEAGRGMHERAWKETKNACLMTMISSPSETDPHLELPSCFCDPDYVEQLVRQMHASASSGSHESREITAISGEAERTSSSSRKPSGTVSTAISTTMNYYVSSTADEIGSDLWAAWSNRVENQGEKKRTGNTSGNTAQETTEGANVTERP